MLTAKGKYGLKALVYLSRQAEGQMTLVTTIAEDNSIPKKFLDAILGELRNGGLVVSRKGKGGGYRLSRAAEAISVGDVMRVLDGPIAPIACASLTRYAPCDDCDVDTCEVRQVMTQVRNAMAEVMDRTSVAQMRDSDATVLPIDIRLTA